MSIRLLTWNLERKKPTTPTGRSGVEFLFGQFPDVMVLTEARTAFPAREGYTVWSRPMHHRHLGEDERRVVLWSKSPWADVNDVGHDDLPSGRFVSGRTNTPLGQLTIVGVCIPWHMSNVSAGDRNKRPWEDHLRYLEVLPEVLGSIDGPFVVAGDFNQRIPRIQGRKDIAEALAACFSGTEIVTTGSIAGVDDPLIDHIALGPGLHPDDVWAWRSTQDGVRMSDHSGVGATVARTE